MSWQDETCLEANQIFACLVGWALLQFFPFVFGLTALSVGLGNLVLGCSDFAFNWFSESSLSASTNPLSFLLLPLLLGCLTRTLASSGGVCTPQPHVWRTFKAGDL